MAIPDFQSIMLPLLQLASDGQVHDINEAVEALACQFQLSDEERSQLLPSGRQATFNNRVAWAKSHLKAAGLLQFPGRGAFQITERGQDLLKTSPKRINLRLLQQYPEFVEFRKGSKSTGGTKGEGEQDVSARTPEELLEEGYSDLLESLSAELLDKVKSATPRFFEKLVVDLLIKMGYGGSRKDAGRAIGKSGDGGIDGIIKEDKLGLDVIYIQAKRWEGTVGRPVVQGFAGSLEGVRAKRGILITTSTFSVDAREYVKNIEKKIVLVDGEMLTKLMIDHGLAVSTIATYEVKKIDNDYFEEA